MVLLLPLNYFALINSLSLSMYVCVYYTSRSNIEIEKTAYYSLSVSTHDTNSKFFFSFVSDPLNSEVYENIVTPYNCLKDLCI